VIKRSTSQESESGQDEMTDGDTDVEEKLLRSTSPSPHEVSGNVKVFFRTGHLKSMQIMLLGI
jgi:hypothetical protein